MVVVFVGLSLCAPGVALADGDNLTGTKWESPKFLDAPITIDQGEPGRPVSAHPFHAAAGFYRGTYDGKRLVLNNTTLSNASETLDCQVSGSTMTCSWITVINGSRDSEPYSFTCANCSGASVASPLPCGTLVAGVVGALLLLLLIGKRVTRKPPPPPVAPAPPPEPPAEQVSSSGPGWKYGNIVPAIVSGAPNIGDIPSTPERGPQPPPRPKPPWPEQQIAEQRRLCNELKAVRKNQALLESRLETIANDFRVISTTAENAFQMVKRAEQSWEYARFKRDLGALAAGGGFIAAMPIGVGLIASANLRILFALLVGVGSGTAVNVGAAGDIKWKIINDALAELQKQYRVISDWQKQKSAELAARREITRSALKGVEKLESEIFSSLIRTEAEMKAAGIPFTPCDF